MSTYLEVAADRVGRVNAPPRYLTPFRHVTLAELHALDATPIELVPAPGVGRMIIPLRAIVRGEGGVPMDMANGNLAIVYADRDGNKGSIFASMPNVGGFDHPFVASLHAPELAEGTENAGLVLTTDIAGGGEIADGYAIDVRVEYEIVEL